MLKTMTVRATIAAILAGLSMSAHAIADSPKTVDIPAGDLRQALLMVSEQFGTDLVFSPEQIQGFKTGGAHGQLTTEQAVTKLLEGTPLELRTDPSGAMLIAPPAAAKEAPQASTNAERSKSLWPRLRLAQTDTPSTSQVDAQNPSPSKGEGQGEDERKAQSPKVIELEEIVVTGSHIRGVSEPVGAQLITIGQEEIRKAGWSTVQEAVRSLPQNFSGGISEDTVGNRIADGANYAGSTSANLRGLGSSATLILLDGRRMAPGGTIGGFTDVSSIPLSAIERIEVLPDGASAVYGSDAVGGVVNIILRKQQQQASTLARFGSVTDGALNEWQLSQSVGGSWEKGDGLLALEYYKRGDLRNGDRRQLDSDLRSLGGDDFRYSSCSPGTITDFVDTWAIPKGQDGTALTPDSFTVGTSNLCSLNVPAADWLAEQKRWNVVGTLRQEISERIDVFANATYARRTVSSRAGNSQTLVVPNTNAFYVNPSGGTDPIFVGYDLTRDLGLAGAEDDVESRNITLGANFKLMEDWRLNLALGEGREENDQLVEQVDIALLDAALADSDPATAFNPFGDGSYTNPATLAQLRNSEQSRTVGDSKLRSVSLTLDGKVFALPGGPVKLALGADYRELSFDAANITTNSLGASPFVFADYDRRTTAVFTELLVPLVGPGNRRSGLERLELSVAARREHYSDFGSATVPRVGLRWSPITSVTLRGAWSKSFAAPNPTSLVEIGNSSNISRDVDPRSPTGRSIALHWRGGNADLTEERARTWTAGIGWAPAAVPGLNLDVGYFDIDHTDRPGRIRLLTDPGSEAAVIRDPTPEQQALVCATTQFLGNTSPRPGNCSTADIDLIIDNRARNLAIVRERGIDLTGQYRLDSAAGRWQFGLNASYLLEFAQAITALAPVNELLDTPDNPLDLRLRSSIGWERGGLSATLFTNYSDDYRDTVSRPVRRIGSWTTFDLTAAYALGSAGAPILRDTELSITAQNLFDREPPFYNNGLGIGYDPSNADLLGRFISMSVRKAW